jgi:hypothetical protein
MLLSSLLASRAGRETLLRARRPHNGKPTHFLAEDLRHALAGFGERPTFSHVNMDPDFNFDDDFTLFSSESDCSNDSNNSKMAFPQQTMCWPKPLNSLTNPFQPEHPSNTAARRSRSPTRDRENNTYRDQRSPVNNYDRSDRRPSRSEQPAGNMEDRQNSQQDRRVYVGNLSYDVKWHHLKDHMREGTQDPSPSYSLTTSY